MGFKEMPPMLTGSVANQVVSLRQYLIRMAKELDRLDYQGTSAAQLGAVPQHQTGSKGKATISGGSGEDIDKIKKNAKELQALIIKTANNLGATKEELGSLITGGDNYVMDYTDSRVDSLSSMYVAKSEFGTFQETIETQIEATAKGVVESYNYAASINSVQDSIDLLQNYYTAINGEIRRGIILDPETGEYVTGIAISQNLQFSGECGPADDNNPKDGYTYYYLNSGQTFGLYTSTGWQFWIDGQKRGWFSSTDGMLHVSNILVENTLQVGAQWQIRSTDAEFEIFYTGG